jgi:hypothetical protein
LAMGKWGSDADWRTLCEWIELPFEGIARDGRVPETSSMVVRRILVSTVVNTWFQRASRPPVLVTISEEGKLVIAHVPGGLGGALAYQFAQLITKRDRQSRCSACNQLLPRNHNARNGVRRYCPSVKCQRAARAHAARDYRSRQKLIARTSAADTLH